MAVEVHWELFVVFSLLLLHILEMVFLIESVPKSIRQRNVQGKILCMFGWKDTQAFYLIFVKGQCLYVWQYFIEISW